ncbi:hypothetical protein [Pedobacter sp. Leaf176]|uniref:hypothetical protein n=1 Tax=Pedobacter sp. Leaf176 TaxID=1736286 RepID=UPI0006FC7432|nr:hypothetical protein [Pedobacter sp. Leaf176]KQR70898.1 hypothetical protein ASF92_05685 [Pedobacter sp. Leaf176]
MKNKFLILSGLFFPIFIQAQTNTFPANGNVGIGTQSPLASLDVRDGHILVKNLANETNESVTMIDHSLGFGPYKNFGTSLRTFTENAGSNSYALQFFTQGSHITGQTEKLRISGNGNLGIGTTNPTERLQVNGNIKWGINSNYMYSGHDGIGVYFEQISNVADENKIRFQTSRSGDAANYAQLFIDATNGFSFRTLGNANGNVGIGTGTPTEKLSVNGKIRAHEIKVEMANWPDYVFEQDYKIFCRICLRLKMLKPMVLNWVMWLKSYLRTRKSLRFI